MIRLMEVIRARNHHTGGSYTTTRHLAAQAGDKVLEGVTAVDTHGQWLPPTPHINITPVRDDRGRFTSEPVTGEEES